MCDLGKSIVDALLNKPFPQNQILPIDLYCQSLKDYGISLSIGYEDIETWDRLGLLHPTIRVRNFIGGVSLDTYNHWLDNYADMVIVPNTQNYAPWNVRVNPDDPTEYIGQYYHPYQLFRIANIYKQAHEHIYHIDFITHPENVDELFAYTTARLSKAYNELQDQHSDDLQLLLLFLLIEDRYLPVVRGSLAYDDCRYTCQDYDNWRSSITPQELLHKSGLSIEQVHRYRFKLAGVVHCLDPNYHWFVLLRHTDAWWRLRLKKEALLAWVYYEAIEVLDLFLTDITGHRQPHADELTINNRWKQNWYGIASEDFDYTWGNALPNVLRVFGLDPRRRVLLVVEGQSEEEFIKTWCKRHGLKLDSLRIRIVSLKTTQNTKNPFVTQFLEDANNDGATVVVVIDDENEVREQIENWVSSGLVKRIFDISELRDPERRPSGALIWRNFEEANFTPDELISAWLNTTKQKRSGQSSTYLKQIADEIRSDIAREPDRNPIKVIEETAKRNRLYFSKVQIAKDLATHCDDVNKPIMILIRNIIEYSNINRTANFW